MLFNSCLPFGDSEETDCLLTLRLYSSEESGSQRMGDTMVCTCVVLYSI